MPVWTITLTGGLWLGFSNLPNTALPVMGLLLTGMAGSPTLVAILYRFCCGVGCYLNWVQRSRCAYPSSSGSTSMPDFTAEPINFTNWFFEKRLVNLSARENTLKRGSAFAQVAEYNRYVFGSLGISTWNNVVPLFRIWLQGSQTRTCCLPWLHPGRTD